VANIDKYLIMDMKTSQVVEISSNYENHQNTTTPVLLNIKGSTNIAKTLRYSEKLDTLFVNIDDSKILIFTKFSKHYEKGDFRYLIIETVQLNGEKIADFLPLMDNRLIILTKDGVLGVYEFSEKTGETEIKFIYRIEARETKTSLGEYFVSLAICPQNRFVIVTSAIDKTQFSKDLLLFGVSQNSGRLQQILRKDISESSMYQSERYGISFLDYYDGFPVFVSTERVGSGSLFVEYFDGEKIRDLYGPLKKIMSDENHMVRLVDGVFFCFDVKGNLLRYEIMDARQETIEPAGGGGVGGS